MIVKEFISKVADGTFTKNDIIEYALEKEDKKDLLWSLYFADKAVEESTGRPQITDETQINRIFNAMEFISERFSVSIYDVAEISKEIQDRTYEMMKPAVDSLKEYQYQWQNQVNEMIRPLYESLKVFNEKFQSDFEDLKITGEKYKTYKNEFDEIFLQYEDYWRVNGIIKPRGIWDLLYWLEECVYPDESFGYIIHMGLEEWYFKEFHQYMELKFNSDWTYEQERKRIDEILKKGKTAEAFHIPENTLKELDCSNLPSLNILVTNKRFNEELYNLMIEIPIIEPTSKENLFYALFGDSIIEFNPIKISRGKRDLFYYLIYKLTGHTPEGRTSPSAEIRKNVCPLFGITNKENRMPNLKRTPNEYDKIDNIFNKYPPNP